MESVNVSSIVNETLNKTMSVNAGGSLLASSVLFLFAIIPIYFGSLLSGKYKDKSLLEVVSSNDAMTFPIMASGALFGLFLLFKIIPQEYINLIVNIHFSIIGTGSMASVLGPIFQNWVPKCLKPCLFKLEFSRSEENNEASESDKWKVTSKHTAELHSKLIPGTILAIAIGIWYFFTRHWVANNIVALSFCVLAIEYIRLNKFMNGCFLLGGLFFYDIFWVFGTPVMVSVAKTLDAPIKVTFPRDFLVHGLFGKQLALLGLGDIVVPGIFVAMLLRFDLSLNRNGSKIYFYTGFIAYITGLLCTFVVMHVFQAAQPALLYLVPTCLGFPLGLALIKGDIHRMFAYEDVPEETTDSKENVEEKKSN